jgi:stage III sporulation protein AE
MKILVKMLIIVVTFSSFTLISQAKEPEEYIEDFEETLPDEYKGLLSSELETAVGPEALLYEIKAILSEEGSSVLAFFLTVLSSIALSCVCSVCPPDTGESVRKGISVITAVAIGGTICRLLVEAAKAQQQANRFFTAIIPLLSGITLAGGGVKGAAVGIYGMNIVLAIVGGGLSALLSALGGFFVAMSLSASVGGSGAINVNRSLKGLFLWIFGIATALLMGTLALQTVIAGASDTAKMRTAKYMASSVIPIAGGAVSASLSILASGLSYVKGVVGGGSIFVLLTMFLSPLIMLLLHRLALSLGVFLSRLSGLGSSAECLASFLGALDVTVAVYSLSFILYVFEVILFIKSGVAAL